MRSDLLVQVYTEEHAQECEEIHFEREADNHFQQDEVDDERRVNTRGESRGKNPLNGSFLGGHHAQNFSENAP